MQEKYDLTPAQYPDFAALRGDPSDNLPGIPGVGEKTAAKWVREFGSLDELVDRVDEVKGKAGDALREHLADVVRNRQTHRAGPRRAARRAGPDDLHLRPVGPRRRCTSSFDTLQFRVLRERLYATLRGAVEPEADEGFDVEVVPPRPGRGRRLARRARRRDRGAGRHRRQRHLGPRHRRR